MILGFDFLGFQAIKRFPTKNRIFLHVMQSTITKNSFLLVFYSYVLNLTQFLAEYVAKTHNLTCILQHLNSKKVVRSKILILNVL